MQCRDIEQAVERDGLTPLPEAARLHVAGCAACSSLVADFAAITAAARQLPSEVEPPARVWVALKAQLLAEDIIREPVVVSAPPVQPWWQGLGHFVRGRSLATAAVAALVLSIATFKFLHTPLPGPTAEATRVIPALVAEPFSAAGSRLDQEEQSLGAMQAASLSDVSSVDNSLRENLATLNIFIKDCRKRLQEDPNDQLARDYLSAAYQQKAEILAAMMERGRSVN